MIERIVPALLFGSCLLALEPTVALAGPKKTHSRPAPSPTPAQTPVPPAAQGEEVAFAHLRLWKASDTKEAAALQIRLVSGGSSNGKRTEVATSAERYQFTSYDDVPAGVGTFEITVPGQSSVRLGVDLVKGQNCTLLVRVHRGIATAELLDNTAPIGDEAPAFSVYSLMFGGKGEVQVNLGDTLTAHLNASGGALRAQGVKPAFYQITVNGTDSDGQALRWNTETDLRKVQRATLIICPDAYGRIRPRLIEDGPGIEPAPDKAANANG